MMPQAGGLSLRHLILKNQAPSGAFFVSGLLQILRRQFPCHMTASDVSRPHDPRHRAPPGRGAPRRSAKPSAGQSAQAAGFMRLRWEKIDDGLMVVSPSRQRYRLALPTLPEAAVSYRACHRRVGHRAPCVSPQGDKRDRFKLASPPSRRHAVKHRQDQPHGALDRWLTKTRE